MTVSALPVRDWLPLAACRTADPELFFPDDSGTPGVDRQALSFCTGCLVRSECLAYALDNGIADGIWGGLTETERDAPSQPSLCASGMHVAVLGSRGACPDCQAESRAEARARRDHLREAARVRDQTGRKGPRRGHRKGVKGIAA